MTRVELINNIIQRRGYKTYLELGIFDGSTFNLVQCQEKTSVDLNFPAMFQGTTDNFFKQNNKKFDLIFIDADHRSFQLIKDINNAFECLSKDGVIVCHDCNPPTYRDQIDENNLYQTAWKAFVLARYQTQYYSFCVNSDCGMGVIDTRQKTKITDKIQIE